MSKQYGLILPGQKKTITADHAQREILKPSIFDESSDSDDNNAPPQLKMKKPAIGPGVVERRMTRRAHEKALEEDPTVFQYDELYEDMESKREDEKQIKRNEPKKPKYIGRLLEVAERRKLENELRIERQVQKEREAEGDQFKDKESFVTSAYRKKLEERKQLEENEKRDEYLESIGDVTKQANIDGFYRHLYEQKTGTTKDVQKPVFSNAIPAEEEITYKPIKSGKSQQRTYRKRQSSDDDNAKAEIEAPVEGKKIHLQNNIDADSDFSIDSSSDEEDNNDEQKQKNLKANDSKEQKATEKQEIKTQIDSTHMALKLDKLKKEDVNNVKSVEKQKSIADEILGVEIPKERPKPKIDRSEIWKKRTVGEIFDAAVQRYFERKAAKEAR